MVPLAPHGYAYVTTYEPQHMVTPNCLWSAEV